MKQIATAFGDDARWRILELLAERPRSVGEVVEITGLRQPQATKHLQTLAQAGLATVFPLGQRRVYAIETGPLLEVRGGLDELLATAETHRGARDIVERYWAAIQADATEADRDRWADGRSFAFERTLPHSLAGVWQYWIDPELLAGWWAPPSLKAIRCLIEPRPEGRVVLDYQGAGERHRSEGQVVLAEAPNRLVFDLTVLDAADGAAFTAHYDLSLSEAGPGQSLLQLGMIITETTVEALPFIAGIETGWNQVLDQLQAAIAGTGASK